MIEFEGGQASLAFDADTHYGPQDHTYVTGSAGTLTSVGTDYQKQKVTIYTAAGHASPKLVGTWFPDGFHGTMGELLRAIEEGREPENGRAGTCAGWRFVLRRCGAAILARGRCRGECGSWSSERRSPDFMPVPKADGSGAAQAAGASRSAPAWGSRGFIERAAASHCVLLVPFVGDAAHDQCAVELDAPRRSMLRVGEKGGFDPLDAEGFDAQPWLRSSSPSSIPARAAGE